MKQVCLIISLFILITETPAQMQTAHWYFGNHAGLDFTGGSPVIDTNGQLDTFEGCTSISDENGNLLFYTDGVFVYNRIHNLMQNGSGLHGHPSSTSSAIIIPKPDDCNLYYIFTIDVEDLETVTKKGMKYTIVDMSLNGGLGAVIQKNIGIPINGQQQGYEKIAGIGNADKTGYWVITHFQGSFYAFEVTGDGVNLTPVVSPTGITAELTGGYLKGSPDGTRLAMGMEHPFENEIKGSLTIYNFDNATGVVSDEILLYPPGNSEGVGFYSLEFSADSRALYTESSTSFDEDVDFLQQKQILQFDLTAPSIIDSKYVIFEYRGGEGAMQRGPDGKIYVARNFIKTYLGIIENPETIYNPDTGEAPVYTEDGVYLLAEGEDYLDRSVLLGLPTFLNTYFRISITVNGLSIKEEQMYCTFIDLDFNFCSQGGEIESIHWDFGDGGESTEFFPQYHYSEPGTYTIVLTLIVDGEEYVRTFEINIIDLPNVENAEQSVCLSEGGEHTFFLEDSFPDINPENGDYAITFHLTQEDAENNENPLPTSFTTGETTVIWVRIENENGCFAVRTLELIISTTLEIEIATPIEICSGAAAVLEVQTAEGNTVNWYENQTDIDPVFTGNPFTIPGLTETTSYWVEVISPEGCISERIEVIIEITEPITPQFVLQTEYCLDAEPQELPIISNNGISGSWNPSVIDTSNLGIQTYIFTPDEGQCAEIYPIEIETTESATPVFSELPESYCLNSEAEDLPETSDNGITGTWFPATIDTSTVGTQTYTFTPNEGQCSGIYSITIETAESLIPIFSDLPDTYCFNSQAEPLPTVSDNGISGSWYPGEINTGIQGITSYVFTPDGNQCSEPYELVVTVYPYPEMELEDDVVICSGDSYSYLAPEGFDHYIWTDSFGNVLSETREIIFTEEGVYTLTVEINGIPCTLSRNIEVSFSTAPIITEIKSAENSLTVYATGNGPFEYSLDEIFWQSSNVFYNLEPGIYFVYVRDKKGCGSTAKQGAIMGVPNFISPNGDGKNDTWKIRELAGFPNTRLQIFDRYGKMFVDRILDGDFEWDGRYNREPLPSGTYWYILILEDGEKLSGHINLRNY